MREYSLLSVTQHQAQLNTCRVAEGRDFGVCSGQFGSTYYYRKHVVGSMYVEAVGLSGFSGGDAECPTS